MTGARWRFSLRLIYLFLIDKIHLGFIFEVNGTEVRLFFKLGCTLFGSDACRAIWQSKWASGKMPCLLCLNVVADEPVGGHDDFFASIVEHDRRRFVRAKCTDIWRKANRLALAVRAWEAGRATKGSWEKLSKALEISYHQEGLRAFSMMKNFASTCFPAKSSRRTACTFFTRTESVNMRQDWRCRSSPHCQGGTTTTEIIVSELIFATAIIMALGRAVPKLCLRSAKLPLSPMHHFRVRHPK